MPAAGPLPPSAAKPPGITRWLPLALLIIGCAGFFISGLGDSLSIAALHAHRQELLAWVTAHEALALAAFGGVYFVVVACSLPGGAVMTVAGGFLFGTVLGTLVTVVAATLGAVVTFLAVRLALGEAARRRVGSALDRMRSGFQEHALSYLLVLRLVPLFPFWLVNLVPALLGVSLRSFVLGTLFGIIPGTLVFASLGSGLDGLFAAGGSPDVGMLLRPEVLGPLLGLAFLSLLPVLYRKRRKG